MYRGGSRKFLWEGNVILNKVECNLNTKTLKRLDPEKNVNKLFENVSCQGRIQNFFY